MKMVRRNVSLLVFGASLVVGCGDGGTVPIRVDAGNDAFTPVTGLDAVSGADGTGLDIAFPGDVGGGDDVAAPADLSQPDLSQPEDTSPVEDTVAALDTTEPADVAPPEDVATPNDTTTTPDTTPPADVTTGTGIVYQLDDVAFTDDATGQTIAQLEGPSMTLVRGGLAMTLAANTGVLNQTAAGFGINATGSGDATDQIDGGAGTAEVLSVTFDADVHLSSIKLSAFSGADEASITIGASAATPVTSSGVIDLGGVVLSAGETLAIAYVAGNGFQVDAVTVALP